jgi:hypothetical protein
MRGDICAPDQDQVSQRRMRQLRDLGEREVVQRVVRRAECLGEGGKRLDPLRVARRGDERVVGEGEEGRDRGGGLLQDMAHDEGCRVRDVHAARVSRVCRAAGCASAVWTAAPPQTPPSASRPLARRSAARRGARLPAAVSDRGSLPAGFPVPVPVPVPASGSDMCCVSGCTRACMQAVGRGWRKCRDVRMSFNDLNHQ